jgi:hypothetical protein
MPYKPQNPPEIAPANVVRFVFNCNWFDILPAFVVGDKPSIDATVPYADSVIGV